MKALLISSRYPPETSPEAKRASGLAGALFRAGHRVTVLTQLPNYPDPSQFAGELANAKRLRREKDGFGNETWRYRPRVVDSERLFARLGAEARFAALVSRPSTWLGDVDGVVASTPFIFNMAAARTYRRPVWLDVRDLTWEYTRHFGTRSRLKMLGVGALKRLALASLRAARRVSTTTERQRSYLVEHGIAPKKVVVVPNGVPRDTFERLGALGAQRAGEGGPIQLAYAGLLGFPQGLEFAVECVAAMPARDVHLHLYGSGVDRAKLEAFCTRERLEHVHIHGHIGFEEYLAALAAADVLFASLRPEADAAMPSKIWEYMAAGKAVLFAGRGEAVDAIQRAGAGRCVDFGDTAQMARVVRELASSRQLREELGARGREWVGRHRIREEINSAWVDEMEQVFGA